MPRGIPTPDRNKKILELWQEGFTATEIGAQLQIGRSAVIGVVHRNRGLVGHRKERRRVDGRGIGPAIASRKRNEARDREILRYWNELQLPKREIAVHFKISEEAVWHVLVKAGIPKEDISGRQSDLRKVTRSKVYGADFSGQGQANLGLVNALTNRKQLSDEPDPLLNPGELEGGRCMYIHGDPLITGWRQCGHPGYPWCEYHRNRFAVQPKKSNTPTVPIKVRTW